MGNPRRASGRRTIAGDQPGGGCPTEGSNNPHDFGIGRLFWLTSEAIVVADLESERIVLWNAAAERLFGYGADEAVGMRLEQLVPADLHDPHLAGIRRYRETRRAVLVGGEPVDVPAVTKDGEQRDIALTLTDVSDDHAGRFVLAIIRDVTAQRRAERDLATANAAMREFVATASHDLRNPLTAIEGFAFVLSEHGDRFGDEQRKESLAAIVRSARHASRLVTDLLTLSQIQVGVLPVRGETFVLATVARRAIDTTGSTATIDIDDSTTVFADPDHVERMLVNYLTNASRYGVPPISVTARRDATWVDVRVHDAGEGPPAEFTDRLFSSFARADPRSSDGTGLGLSIVRGLAEANGGAAYYDNNDGTSFGVRLRAGPP